MAAPAHFRRIASYTVQNTKRLPESVYVYAALYLCVLMFCGCSGGTGEQRRALAVAPDVAAQVGTIAITTSLVANIANEAHIPPREALERATEDAIFASHARATGVASRAPLLYAQRASLAAMVPKRLQLAATKQGAFTDAELTAFRKLRWREYAVPDAVRVVHAVVRNNGKPPAWDEAAAMKQAQALREAVSTAAGPEQFMQNARILAQSPYEVRVEALDPFAADGRVVQGADGNMEATFSAASHALAPGQLSVPILTKFGIHIIYAVEKLPAMIVPDAEVVERAGAELLRMRARKQLESLLESRRTRVSISIDPATAELMAQPFAK
jgi:hypothetical protein